MEFPVDLGIPPLRIKDLPRPPPAGRPSLDTSGILFVYKYELIPIYTHIHTYTHTHTYTYTYTAVNSTAQQRTAAQRRAQQSTAQQHIDPPPSFSLALSPPVRCHSADRREATGTQQTAKRDELQHHQQIAPLNSTRN